ncbi:SNF2-related protein [Methylotenera sp.]|uniref:SNF2-related protein n=1 Tax=Methylotenera sp. TaxID=2051956 RepID=UPI00273231EC|nr:SNF2-related protein [Methylotenera sp.]MDP3308289.1 SNF2-related protein [Methylotenera sp.]
MTAKPPPLFKHQKFSVRKLAATQTMFDMSDPGCVSADTEYLTPTGWKRIDKYESGDNVAQFHPDSREIEFVAPLAFVKRPCTTMIAIAPSRGMSQRISHEHRVLYYKPDGTHKTVAAAEYMHELHRLGPSHYKAKFSSTFSVRSTESLDLSDLDVRLMVAIIADGHFPPANNSRCIVRLKKTRKIKRLRELLLLSKTDYDVRQCGGQPEFTIFTFRTPRRDKDFGAYWWGASQRQLEIIANEVCHWDSSEDKRPSNGTRFSTFLESSADFIQYAFAAAKRPASVKLSVRDRTKESRGIMAEYNVHALDADRFVGPGRRDSVFEIPNPEGFKYCFEVPTSYLVLRHNGYIFATGNTGKTRVQIEDFAARRRAGGAPALILATKSLLQSAWGEDFRKFAPDMKVSVAYAENRDKAFAATADVYITNHDAVAVLAKKPASFWKPFKNGTLIIDESSAYKHHTSMRSKAVAKLSKIFTWRRLMSGTPNSNGICDLWHQILILDGGKRLGTSFFGFRNAVCSSEQIGPMAQMVKWVDKPHAEATVSAAIADITIRHRFEDCVDIPENHKYSVPFEMNSKHRALYDALEAESVLYLNSGKNVSAINGAALYTKLLQTASGAVYAGEEDYALIDTDRYELVMDLAEQRKHSIVFFNWKHQRDELIKLAEKRGISYALIDGSVTKKGERERIVKGYENGAYQVLFGHPKSMAHGLTLVKGTATIWASPTSNLEYYLQGLKRIHRIGQKEKTETVMVVAAGTIEERVYESLQEKDLKMGSLLNYLKKAA